METAERRIFEVDTCAALEALSTDWGAIYHIGHANGRWRAQRRDGTAVILTCETPDELAVAMRAHWSPR